MRSLHLAILPLLAVAVVAVVFHLRGSELGAAGSSPESDSTSSLADSYRGSASRIIDAALADSAGFERLAYLADTYGPRLSGSPNLEKAIDWILAAMTSDGLENVRGEEVVVPKWVRGRESLTMEQPRQATLAMLGLGGSIGTGPEGVEADLLVVGGFDELASRAAEADGKIVLYNVPFTTYSETVRYRVEGASRAARTGAVASLIRSVGPASMYTPHTGMMQYEPGVRRIPHAAITLEDAAMMQRMNDRGQHIRLRLMMEARHEGDARSRNVVAELVGSESPDEIVVMGGHIDSWDVGQGAMDDAGGCVAAWHALLLMQKLGLRPRRTVRVVMWTNEENGLRGAEAYKTAHADELHRTVLAIESDSGVFAPTGFGFSGSPEALAIVTEIAQLLEPIGAATITQGGGGADIAPLMREGVPGMGLSVDTSRYFWYHHTHADTIDKLDPHEFNLCVAALAVMAYVAADMPSTLPRPPGTN